MFFKRRKTSEEQLIKVPSYSSYHDGRVFIIFVSVVLLRYRQSVGITETTGKACRPYKHCKMMNLFTFIETRDSVVVRFYPSDSLSKRQA